MKLARNKKIKDLQIEFNKLYPYLKIEFFDTPNQNGEGTDEIHLIDPNTHLNKMNMDLRSGTISTNKKLQVREFEKMFETTFGLYVQVYRKSHGKWLQTWATDIWTLEEQNHRGKILGDIDDLLLNKIKA